MLDSSQLRAFVAVAEELHFGRAAARLNITQSPLSRHVQNLEHALGVALLVRTSRSVQLTHAGAMFLPEARRVLQASAQAEQRARDAARGLAGFVRLGFTSASAHEALPLIVARLRATLPELELVLQQMVTTEQVAALAARQLDLGLARPSTLPVLPDGGRIRSALLLRERLLLAMPADHPWAGGPPPAMGMLHGQPFVTWSPQGGSYFLDLMTALFRGTGISPGSCSA